MKRLILALLTGVALAASSPAYAAVNTIVLVHGAFADGSGWKPVADILQSHGYSVLVVQEPETSFAADVAATRRVLDKAGPCVLVGHSYGGMITTETGMHPDVKALVYVAAAQPDVGESLSDLLDKMPPAAIKNIGPVGDGFLAVNPDAFPNEFAADVPEAVARFMAISQVPLSGGALLAKATVAALETKAKLRSRRTRSGAVESYSHAARPPLPSVTSEDRGCFPRSRRRAFPMQSGRCRRSGQ